MQPLSSNYAAVKNYLEAEQSKRKQLDSQAKQAPSKRARSDENASHAKTSALLDELLERETRMLGAVQPPAAADQGPTDFSGMFPKAAAAAQQQQQQQQGQRAARTFEDLAHRQPGRQVLGDLLPANDYLPPALPAAADATNLAAAAAAGGSGDRQLAPADTPPLDWSLKTTVRFSSAMPFAVAEDAALLSAGEVMAAQRAAAACDAGTHSLSMQQRFLAALHSWQFPHDPWRQPAPRLRGGALPPESLQRRLDWQAAFGSLYDALRCGACDAFYYLSPEGTKKPCAVLFGAAGVGGRPRIHALLTRSTAGLRALLSGGHSLGFAAPLLPADADRRVETDQSAVPLDGSQSLLVFEGGLRVHGLFDFLLNESFRTHGDECDVPTLLAPVQFAHASLRAFQPRVLGRSEARAGNGPTASRTLHRLELRAPALPPWVLDRLASVLAVTQDGNFTMACDTQPVTLALNWRPAASSSGAAAEGGNRRGSRRTAAGNSGTLVVAARQLTEYEARQRGCWDSEEAARWRAAVPGLSCNVVRELCCKGGCFVAKLSAKSAERVVL